MYVRDFYCDFIEHICVIQNIVSLLILFIIYIYFVSNDELNMSNQSIIISEL